MTLDPRQVESGATVNRLRGLMTDFMIIHSGGRHRKNTVDRDLHQAWDGVVWLVAGRFVRSLDRNGDNLEEITCN